MPASYSPGSIEERTASYNRLRGLVSEFGLIAPQSTEQLRKLAREHRENLPGWVNQCVDDLLSHIDNIELKITGYDRILAQNCGPGQSQQKHHKTQGVDPTTASALIASIGSGYDFKNSRQLAAWLDLTPSQYSSGGKAQLGKITKAGDVYLRTLLVQGARSVMIGVEHKQDPFSRWVCSLINRRGYWRAVVAIAAKNARLCWASLNYGDDFKLYSSPNS